MSTSAARFSSTCGGKECPYENRGAIAAFGKEFARSGALDRKFHRYLLDAQDARNVGDYGVGPGVTTTLAREALDWAREFIATAEQFLSGAKE